MKAEGTAVHRNMMKRAECQPVLNDVRAVLRMPLDVGRIDAEYNVIHSKIVTACCAAISIGAEHIGPECAIPFGNSGQIFLADGRQVACRSNAVVQRVRKVRFEDKLSCVVGDSGILLQKLESILWKPAFCRVLAQPADKESAGSTCRQNAVAGNLPNPIGAQMTKRVLRMNRFPRRSEFYEQSLEWLFYFSVSDEALATIQHSTERQQQEKRLVRRTTILVYVDGNSTQSVE